MVEERPVKTGIMWKCVQLTAALLLWLALSYALLVIIALSDFELDFSLRTQLLKRLNLWTGQPERSLVPLMQYMLLGASGSVLTLILLQFITLVRRVRKTLTSRWTELTRALQLMLGAAAAVLLAVIGFCLKYSEAVGMPALILSGLLALRLGWHIVRSWRNNPEKSSGAV